MSGISVRQICATFDPHPCKTGLIVHNCTDDSAQPDACADIKPEAKFVVYLGNERFKMSNGVDAINVAELARLLA